jgi:hypothetical protein
MAWQLSIVPNGISGEEVPLMTTTTKLVLSNPRVGISHPEHHRTSFSALLFFRQTLEIPALRVEAVGSRSIRYSPLHLRALSPKDEKEVWIWDRDEL